MKRDQELVTLFLHGYNRLAGDTFHVTEWCDEIERQRPAVEAIACNALGRRVAIEHTLIQPFLGERDDTQVFHTVFLELETNPAFRIPGYDIELWPAVGAIPKGTNWGRVAAALAEWFLSSAKHFPEGDSIQRVPGLGFDLAISVAKEPHPEGAVFVGRSGMPDTFDQVLEHAMERKLPKLQAASADARVLLLEKVSGPLAYAEVSKHIEKLKLRFPRIDALDQIWFVNTIGWQKTGSVWFLKTWPNDVGARFTLRATPDEPDSAIYVRGFGEAVLWRQFRGYEHVEGAQ